MNVATPSSELLTFAIRIAFMGGMNGLLVAGCAVGPDYVQPKTEVPTHWTEAPLADPQSMHLNDWWKTFNDPTLNWLIKAAIQSNLDLKLAESRVREARANRDSSFTNLLPTFSARTDVMGRQNNANFGNASVGGLSGSGGGINTSTQTISIFQTGFDASWEVDIFGGIRRSVEAAEANLEAQEENRRNVLVSLLGEVARNYIELRSNQQLLAVTRDNLKSQENTLELVRLRYQAGLTSELEVAQTEGLTAETRSQAPVYEALARQSIHALGILLGQAPGKFAHRLQQEGPLPSSIDPAQADLPSELLRRRPDIREAERKLAVSNANIGVATAELYPKLKLNAFLGAQNTNLTALTPMGQSWSLLSSLSMPVFNWGRLQANLRAKEALNEQSFLTYQSTVLKAFKEVEDALVAHAQEQIRIASLEKAVEAQRLALTLSIERYTKGLTAYLDVLTAERALFQTQRELVDSQAKLSAQLVALYKALGGGWQTQEMQSSVN